jgi:hypothetical protein
MPEPDMAASLPCYLKAKEFKSPDDFNCGTSPLKPPLSSFSMTTWNSRVAILPSLHRDPSDIDQDLEGRKGVRPYRVFRN